MHKYLLYLASPENIVKAKKSLKPFESSTDTKEDNSSYLLTSSHNNEMTITIYFVTQIENLNSYLRSFPLDLLIFDERQHRIEATKALDLIKSEISFLAANLGLDFHFSMNKVVAILAKSSDLDKRAFYLGRRNLKEVFINPENFFQSRETILSLLMYNAKEKNNHSKIGFACGGGGLDGYIYSLGCVYAINHALKQGQLEDCDFFSGISSGSIIATLLAKKMPLEENIKALYGQSKIYKKFSARMLYDFAGLNFFRRMMSYGLSKRKGESLKISERFLRSVPTGLFHGEKFVRYFEECIDACGVTNSFEEKNNNLFIGATDQDTFEHVVLGEEPWNQIKVSDAIRASSALVPILAPWKINDYSFIDGQITRSCNIGLLIRKGCNLIIIVDPLIPYSKEITEGVDIQGGFYTVLQTIKALIYSRFKARLSHLHERYPDVSFILFQPEGDAAYAMRGSPMKYKVNKNLLSLAFKSTLWRIRKRYRVYDSKLQNYSLGLKDQDELNRLSRYSILDLT